MSTQRPQVLRAVAGRYPLIAIAVVAVLHSTSWAVSWPLRSWSDDTGAYQVQARLFRVSEGHVRLLKQDGRTTTVPLDRLSPADQEYVARVSGQSFAAGPTVAVIRVSRTLLVELLSETRHQQRPIQTTILGTSVRGQTTAQTTTGVTLHSSVQRAVLTLPVRGAAWSTTTSFSGPVQVHSCSHARYASAIYLALDGNGLRIRTAPTQAVSHSQTTGISSSFGPLVGRIAHRIAARVAATRRPQYDEIAANRLATQVDVQIAANIARTRQETRQLASAAPRHLAASAAEFPIDARFSSTPEALAVRLVWRGPGEPPVFASPLPKPALRPPALLTAQLHKSLVARALAHADQADELTEVVKRLLASRLTPLVRAQQLSRRGTLDTAWSDDQEWLLVRFTLAAENR